MRCARRPPPPHVGTVAVRHLLQVGLRWRGDSRGRGHRPSGPPPPPATRRPRAGPPWPTPCRAPRSRDDGDRAHEARSRPVRRHGRRQVADEAVEQRPALFGIRPCRDHPARRWTIPVAPLRHADGAAAWRSAPCGRARPTRGAPPRGRWPAATTSRSARRARRPRRRRRPARPAHRPPRPCSAARPTASASSFPPWALTNTTPANERRAERTSSTSRSARTECPTSSVPGKSACSPLAP